MERYLVRRIAYVVPLWLGVSLLAFGLGRLAPGDPARQLLVRITGQQPSQAEVEEMRHRLGLDGPVPVQYGLWVARAVRGDLGTSYLTGRPVSGSILETLPKTAELAGAAFVLALAVGIPLGIVAAARSWRWTDHVVRGLALVGASVPSFWLGYLLILGFAVHLGWFPAFGSGGLPHLVLPAVTLSLSVIAVLARLTRAALLETFGEDYIRTALAKGLRGRQVLLRHAFRAALNPVVSRAGVDLGILFGFSLVVETVFAWPGLGFVTVQAIGARDYPFLQGFVLLMGTVFLFLNLVVDVLYTWIDPRVRLAEAEERPVVAVGTGV